MAARGPRFVHVRQRARRQRLRPNGSTTAIQIGLYAAIFGYAIFYNFLKPLGAVPLLTITAAATIVTIVYARRYIEPLLIAFGALGLIYLVASYAGMAHQNLTLMYDVAVIPQQAYYTFTMALFVPCFAYFGAKIEAGDRSFLRLEKVLLVACIVEQMLRIAVGMEKPWSFLQTASNPDAIMAFIVARRLLEPGRMALQTRWVILILAALAVVNFQTTLVVALLAAMLLFRRFSPLLLMTYIGALVIAAFVSLYYAETLWELDPNTGVRGLFWRDALEVLFASNGLGVGFGTESIRPTYFLGGSVTHVVDIAEEGFINVGLHNAFMDTIYRMGIPGFVILAVYVGRLQLRAVSLSRFSSFDRWTAGLLFTILMVNVGLASPNHLFAATLLLGWLLHRSTRRIIRLHRPTANTLVSDSSPLELSRP